jgi:hypothetical protein
VRIIRGHIIARQQRLYKHYVGLTLEQAIALADSEGRRYSIIQLGGRLPYCVPRIAIYDPQRVSLLVKNGVVVKALTEKQFQKVFE